mgnify:CR=1 FL=1
MYNSVVLFHWYFLYYVITMEDYYDRTEQNKIKQCQEMALRLHAGVEYGKGLSMLDQVNETAALVQEKSNLPSDKKTDVICAAYLHKSQEVKRIAEGQSPLTDNEIAELAGQNVAKIVQILHQEPEDKNKTKQQQWEEKAEWARSLSAKAQNANDKFIAHAVQEILLAEKVQNFRTSRDKPNPKKTPIWHKQYYATRMVLVEALRDVNPALCNEAKLTKEQGIKKLEAQNMDKRGLPYSQVLQQFINQR